MVCFLDDITSISEMAGVTERFCACCVCPPVTGGGVTGGGVPARIASYCDNHWTSCGVRAGDLSRQEYHYTYWNVCYWFILIGILW